MVEGDKEGVYQSEISAPLANAGPSVALVPARTFGGLASGLRRDSTGQAKVEAADDLAGSDHEMLVKIYNE